MAAAVHTDHGSGPVPLSRGERPAVERTGATIAADRTQPLVLMGAERNGGLRGRIASWRWPRLDERNGPAVDLDLTTDQELFLQTTTRFIEATCPLTAVRQHAAARRTPGPSTAGRRPSWAGSPCWFPRSLGGGRVSDNGMLDAALVAQARGAALQPGPLHRHQRGGPRPGRGRDAGPAGQGAPLLLSGEETATWAVTGSGPDPGPTGGVRARQMAGGTCCPGPRAWSRTPTAAPGSSSPPGPTTGPPSFWCRPTRRASRSRVLEGLDLTRRLLRGPLRRRRVAAFDLVGAFGGATARSNGSCRSLRRSRSPSRSAPWTTISTSPCSTPRTAPRSGDRSARSRPSSTCWPTPVSCSR